MAEGNSRGRKAAVGLAVLVAGIGIGDAMSSDGDSEGVIVAGTTVERSTTTERIIPTTTSTITTTSTTTTTIDVDAGCKTALQTPEVSGPFTACTAAQYIALQPIYGPGKPELYAACQFQYMGPACDGIPTTTTAPPPPPPTAAPRRAPTTTAPRIAAPANECDANYEWECVPAGVSDVDCSSGSGNGPYYVSGPVRVVGTDIYGLDGNDNDGIGCEG